MGEGEGVTARREDGTVLSVFGKVQQRVSAK
jgi:hypothetical protein